LADSNWDVMRRLRENWLAVACAGVGVWSMVYLGLYGFAWTDYDFEATPSYDALTAGHVWRFFELAPAYGGSLELRAPFALLPGLWGGGEQAVYELVGLVCLIAGGLLGLWLFGRLRKLGATRLARWTALGLCAANPVTIYACQIGHPEELLGAVLCVAALLAARGKRVVWAGLLLGLAIVNKEWALIAIGPVLLALPAHRWRALAIAAATATVFYAPLMIAQWTAHTTPSPVALSGTGSIFQPWQIWWFLGATGHVVRNSNGVILHGYREAPAWLSGLTHPLIVLLGVPLTLLAARQGRRREGSGDALLLLVALLLVRCVLDPWDDVYYLLPFIIALVSWESLERRRPPLLGLIATFATWAVFEALPANTSADARSAIFLALALPALIALGLAIYAPRTLSRASRRWTAPARIQPSQAWR